MEEQNSSNTKKPNENAQTKEQLKKQGKNGGAKKSSFSETVTDYKAEFKRIIWPSRKEVAKNTVTVVLTSFLLGIVIFGMDTVYTVLYDAVLALLG